MQRRSSGEMKLRIGTLMNGLVKDVLVEVAEILPALSPDEKEPLPRLPVDGPNFPNDLEPLIRADPPRGPPALRRGSGYVKV